jgi:hypothetical protein
MAVDFQLAPGGAELWSIDGALHLVYTVPTLDPPVYMAWRVRDDEQMQAHLPEGASATPDRTITQEEYDRAGGLDFGFSDELRNFNDHPAAELEENFEQEAAVQPWLNDPEVLAIVTAALYEGRAPTTAELSSTGYFQERSGAEVQWVIDLATDPQAARDRRAAARRTVADMLRQAGVNDASEALVNILGDRMVEGRWSENFIADQIRGLSDPTAGVKLQGEVIVAAQGFDPRNGDEAAVAAGPDAVRARVRAIFEERGVEIAANGESAGGRLDRITAEVMAGRSIRDVRRSINRLAGRNPVTGTDITRAGEDRVRQLLQDWVGPHAAQGYDEAWVAEWAGRLRNDPDAEQDLIEALQGARMANLPNWTNPNLRYADIAPIARGLFSQVWGVSPDETDPLFLDVLNMPDRHEAAKVLRTEGLNQNVGKVIDDAFSALSSTSLGDAVVRSPV